MPAAAAPPESASQANENLLRQAVDYYHAGRLLEAAQLYQTILQADPGHPEANHNLGVIAVQAQQAEAALAYLAAALDADPTRGRYWVSYINALIHAGREDEARSVLALAREQGLEGDEVDALVARISVDGWNGTHGPTDAAPSDTQPARGEVDALLGCFNAGRLEEAANRARAMVQRFPSYAFGWKALGAVLKTLDRSAEALEPMRKAASLSPNDPEAHYNLGVVLQQLGRPEDAEASYRQALELHPGYADASLNLGVALNQMQRFGEAEGCLREVLRMRPASAAAHGNLGAVLEAQARLDEAEASYRQAVAISPDTVEGHLGLGRVLRMRGRLEDSEASLARAVAIDPAHAKVHAELALTLQERERLDEADRHFMEALRLDPTDVATGGNRGNLLCQLERLVEAEFCYRAALDIDPDDAGLHANLGKLLKNLGRLDEAEKSFRHALQLDPDDLEIRNRLGLTLYERGRLDEAEACFQSIVQADPTKPNGHSNLGCVLMALGRLDAAAAAFRKALEIAPEQAITHSNLLYALSLSGGVDARSLFAEHVGFGERFEAPHRAAWPAHANLREPDRGLRIGFVSADFYNHAVASFIEPVLAELARYPGLELHAYYNHFVNDAVTQRLQAHFAHWNQIPGWSDDELVERVRGDGIDILIDLAGHTGYNRLTAFAKKPAPVQASWIGYPGTTGLAAIDYYLADRFVLPVGRFDDKFTEKIVRLPASAPFQPFAGAPPVNALPALDNGHITFGSFNRREKLSREVIALWSRLLRELPDSRMLLGGMPESGHHDTLIAWFEEEGIERERLEFQPRSGLDKYLALHHRVDICLDTFPYNGGTTTHHALWMGVPTLTLAGQSMAGRAGSAILSRVGLQDFAVDDVEAFVAQGLHWADRLDALAALRSGLREHLAASPLRRPENLAAGLARALRIMWRRWCAGLPPASFEVTLEGLAQPKGGVLE